ncbi:unnamed protein product [Mytilus coruscus]|uniref:Reverse transcriptase domain-containing protein n=1 Tax=Mytilus coruscus TaxID=42192 RepID=A0A6J8CQ11_MYTCO|nr:unnamed protein product [Mytilus coruscus]
MEKAISGLNRNKAVDNVGINAENNIYGGKQLQQYLQLLFDKSFELGCVHDILNIGTLFPLYKNKGDNKSAKNYRGITIAYIQSNFMYKMQKMFEIEQGVRQGGPISADLYKLYVNPLLNILCETGLGGHIGDIGCYVPTCADDVTIISNNPLELQMLINIAANCNFKKYIHVYWLDKINKDSEGYSSLKYISGEYKITSNPNNTYLKLYRDIIKLPIRTRIASGNYILQTNRAKFNKNEVPATCKACCKEDETISHLLNSCTALEPERVSFL